MEQEPRRVVLVRPVHADAARRYEVLPGAREAMKRVEEFALRIDGRRDTRDWPTGAPSRRSDLHRRPGSGPPMSVAPCRILSFRNRDGFAVRSTETDCSQRIYPPTDAILAADAWMGQALGIWRDARSGSSPPSIESLDLSDLPGMSGGKAHLLDTNADEPEGYWFRHWGRNNSYVAGHNNLTLGQMPSGLMREAAMEDYRRAVTTAAPCYSLISMVEGSRGYSYAQLILPLATRGQRADHLLVLINERDLTLESA